MMKNIIKAIQPDPKKDIKNLFPKLINDIKNNKKPNIQNGNISFENLLKEAMNYLDKK